MDGATVSKAGSGSITVRRAMSGGAWWCQASWGPSHARQDVTVVHYDGHGPLLPTVAAMVVSAPEDVRAMVPALWAELRRVAP